MNKLGGFDIEDSELIKRAKKADLVTLAKNVEGTNCFNCEYIKIVDKTLGIGSCRNPEVAQPVTQRMCCALWDSKGTLRSWEK